MRAALSRGSVRSIVLEPLDFIARLATLVPPPGSRPLPNGEAIADLLKAAAGT